MNQKENEQSEVLQLKAEMYDLHKNYHQQIQEQQQLLQLILNKLGFEGNVKIDDVLNKIETLQKQTEESVEQSIEE